MKRNFLLFLSLCIIFISSSRAQEYAVSVKASTLGINGEIIRSFGSNINLRIGAAAFSYSLDGGGGTEQYKYTADAKLLSASLLADYFPFGQVFRLTGGVFFNFNKANIDLVPTKTTTLGGDEYTPEKLGSLQASLDFKKVAPYIGIGFGNPTSGNAGLGFTFDIGTVYQGPANVDLTANGLLEPSAAPDQEELLESNLGWFKWYPVVSLGLIYKF
ncbi:MAG: hypothetical protein R6W90_02600 [Ignavibacteriaceae bacterium]